MYSVHLARGRGAELDAGFEHVFDMRDGKVVRFANKPDDGEAWTASWTS